MRLKEIPVQTNTSQDRPRRPTVDTTRAPPTAPRAARSAGLINPITGSTQPTTMTPQMPPRGLTPGSRPTQYRAGNEKAYISDSSSCTHHHVPTLNSLPRLPPTAQPMAIPSSNEDVDRTLQQLRDPTDLEEVTRLRNLISSLHGRGGLGEVLTPSATNMRDQNGYRMREGCSASTTPPAAHQTT
ncbi:hypothetical protein V5O48_010914, partial [Marasmius crinis-equi]